MRAHTQTSATVTGEAYALGWDTNKSQYGLVCSHGDLNLASIAELSGFARRCMDMDPRVQLFAVYYIAEAAWLACFPQV